MCSFPIQSSGKRSDFLIHWTGKDINSFFGALINTQRQKYVDRLLNTLLPSDPNNPKTNGLWMSESEEEFLGEKGVPQKFGFSAPMTCFTEIKLSLTREHTERYGCLGFGFSRAFVLKRGGMPVFYVDFPTEDGGILRHFARQRIIIDSLIAAFAETVVKQVLTPDVVSLLEKHLLSKMQSHQLTPLNRVVMKKYIDQLPGVIKNRGFEGVFYTLLNSVVHTTLFVKLMSHCRDPRDYAFLNESEWRVVMPVILRQDPGKNPLFHHIGYKEEPEAKIWFTQDDLKVLIFPDPKTRDMALKDDSIFKWFGRKFPIMATIEECLNF